MDRQHSFNSLNSQLIGVLTGLVLTGCITQLIQLVTSPFRFCIPVWLIAFHFQAKLTNYWRSVLAGSFLAIILFSTQNLLLKIFHNIAQPPEWDFLCFWLSGKVAAQGLNFYEPEHARQLAQALFTPSLDFTHEILDVGFWYPPPSIFLFLPLGWFDPQTAISLWSIFHLSLLIGCVFWLWKFFLKDAGRLGLVFSAALVLPLQGTLSTFEFSQTNFLALLMLLFFWRDRSKRWGGVWLAIGILAKPFLTAVLLYLFLRKYWRSLTTAIASLTAMSLMTVIIFGSNTFFSYFNHNNRAELPPLVYTETVNQSLLAFLLRSTQYDFSHASPFSQPLFIPLSLILMGTTAWIVFKLNQANDDWALIITLLLALLIYPASLYHYSVILIIPLLVFWNNRGRSPFAIGSVTLLISLEYVLMSQYRIFIADLILWLILAGIGIRLILRPSLQPTSDRDMDDRTYAEEPRS